jgi:hypothetical protein
MSITKIAFAVVLLPWVLGAQVQPRPLPDAVRVIRDSVHPQQPGLVSFRVYGGEVPSGTWATLNLTLKSSDPATAGVTAQYGCQVTETLFYCPVLSMYGKPSGVFQITSIVITSNTASGQSTRIFKAGQDFHSADLTIENPKAPQPPNLDGLKIADVDVDNGR